ncbi:hypothetical protein [Niallia taxi]|uniref:hypothetical protein n=1 Tax=Niallia taxi TaxID=2499688 RepID=UPI002E1F4A6B|nr:hypothetical protein [Niallia taxi]
MAQAYKRIEWKDHVVDGTKIIQQGTPASASNFNKMDAGIELAHQKLEGSNRQTQAISHGLQMLNGDVNAQVSLQMEGRSLIPLQNTPAEIGKFYILADKKTWLSFTPGNTFKGVQKFTGQLGLPVITRVANFEEKIRGSLTENPHVAKSNSQNTGNWAVLGAPNTIPSEFDVAYASSSKLDGVLAQIVNTVPGNLAIGTFAFNIIEEIERNEGRIPGTTLAQKIKWLQDNVAGVTINAHAWGSGAAGNKLTLSVFSPQTNTWNSLSTHANATVTKLTHTLVAGNSPITAMTDGIINWALNAEAASASIQSVVAIDYVEVLIELKAGAILLAPRVPFYEVTKEHYDAALVTWNEDEIIRRYPTVEGVQHIQNPFVMAEGENLIPPFSEWSLTNQNAVLLEPYKFEINPTGAYAHSWSPNIPVIPNEIYTLYGECDNAAGYYTTHIYDKNGTELTNNGRGAWRMPANAAYARIRATNGTMVAKMTFYNVSLTPGGNVKPFMPRNTSYFYAETKLGAIGTAKDLLYDQDGKTMVRKIIEKDIALDGSKTWIYHSSQNGNVTAKVFGLATNLPVARSSVLTKYNGKLLTVNAVVNDADTYNGLNSTGDLYLSTPYDDMGITITTYAPTNDEVKAYFNGWKVKTVDANGKPTAWKSIVDGTDAPTQTLAYVAANKATGYTPYMLSYVLSTPNVSEVKNEGSISVNGPTQIEVGSGVVFREKASFALNGQGTSYNINSNTIANTSLSNRVGKFLALYKGTSPVKEYFISRDQFAIGYERLGIDKDKFDTTADYYVTYLVYDRNKFTSNPLTASATFANSIRTALDDNIKVTEDNKREISIQALQIYNMLVRLKAGGI